MKLDIKRAVVSPFSDSQWKSKISILILLALINAILERLGWSLLWLIPAFISTGYCLQFAHNEIHDIKPLLPNWSYNFLKYLKYGTIFGVISGLYTLIIILLVSSFIKLPFNKVFIIGLFTSFLIVFLVSGIYCYNFKFKESFNGRKIFDIVYKKKMEFFITIPIIFILLITFYNLSP